MNSMNILIVSFHQVYPLETGASVSQFGMIEYLSHFCNISLLLPEESHITEQEFTELKQLLPKVKIYALNTNIHINSNSQSYKISSNAIKQKLLNIVRYIKNKTNNLLKKIFITSEENDDCYNHQSFIDISPEEVDFINMYSLWNPYSFHSKQYVDKVNEIILQDKIEIIQMEYTDNLNLVTFIPSHIKKIFVEHECVFLRIKSHIKAKGITSPFAQYVMNLYECFEISLLEKIDAIITFNQMEYEIFKKFLLHRNNKIKILVSPFSIPNYEFREIKKENFLELNKLIFIGSEHHYPNKDAVEWFLEETALEIFNKFGLRLYVVGNWKEETVKKYQEHPSQVKFVGFIKDIYEFSKGSISIAPIRIGAGLRTKIMLSMAHGIPVISTQFGLEGINAKHLENVIIADDKNSFCWALEYLLSDLERAFLICQNAQKIMKENYSQSVTSKLRYSFYKEILDNS